MSNRTSDQNRFIEMVESFPRLSGYWDFEAWQVDPERIKEDYEALSSGEQVLISFLMSVWFGRNRDFDITRAAGILSNDNKKIIVQWFLDPFWP